MIKNLYYSAATALLIATPFLFTFVCEMSMKQVISSVAFAVIYGWLRATGATKENLNEK